MEYIGSKSLNGLVKLEYVFLALLYRKFLSILLKKSCPGIGKSIDSMSDTVDKT